MKTVRTFQKMKQNGEPIVMLTAYDYPSAKVLEASGVDMILVGDSLGMVVLGYDSTVPVTVEDMVHHGRAVRRGAPDTFVVLDMPFMSYHVSVEKALENVDKIFRGTSANAVKLEGAEPLTLEVIKRFTAAGVPTFAHLGLTPQSIGTLGGYFIQGKGKEEALKLIEDSIAVEQAGAAFLLLECVPQHLGKIIKEKLSIPVIGIGGGQYTDGQLLIYHDLVGYGDVKVPSFAKQYVNIQESLTEAVGNYVSEVKNEQFPTSEYSFHTQDTEDLAAELEDAVKIS